VPGEGLTGRWRYDRRAGRGIALTYELSVTVASAPRRPDFRFRRRIAGRWRFDRTVERGIALRYARSETEPPAVTPAPPPTHSPTVAVLCFCGCVFSLEDDAGACPGCGQPAEWPTMGVVEREMRADLEELLRANEQDIDPD